MREDASSNRARSRSLPRLPPSPAARSQRHFDRTLGSEASSPAAPRFCSLLTVPLCPDNVPVLSLAHLQPQLTILARRRRPCSSRQLAPPHAHAESVAEPLARAYSVTNAARFQSIRNRYLARFSQRQLNIQCANLVPATKDAEYNRPRVRFSGVAASGARLFRPSRVLLEESQFVRNPRRHAHETNEHSESQRALAHERHLLLTVQPHGQRLQRGLLELGRLAAHTKEGERGG